VLALVHTETFETALHAIRERCCPPTRIGEDEHADRASLPVAERLEFEPLGCTGLPRKDRGDRRHRRAGLCPEKGERDVEALDRSTTTEVALAPTNELDDNIVRDLERDEEPDPVIALDGSSRHHADV
jgi:hypothetical protein